MDNVIWCRRSEESLVPSQLNHRPWAQFGALAFLLLFLTFFNGVLLLFLFLRQLILSSCHNSNLLSSIGFSLSKSSWWGETDHVGNFHLIPYQNASLVSLIFMLPRVLWSRRSWLLWRRCRVWPARPAGGPRHLLPLLVMGIILILELKPRGDLMGLRHANLVSVKKACKERKMQRITKESFASAQTPHNASSFTSHQKPTS